MLSSKISWSLPFLLMKMMWLSLAEDCHAVSVLNITVLILEYSGGAKFHRIIKRCKKSTGSLLKSFKLSLHMSPVHVFSQNLVNPAPTLLTALTCSIQNVKYDVPVQLMCLHYYYFWKWFKWYNSVADCCFQMSIVSHCILHIYQNLNHIHLVQKSIESYHEQNF